MKLSLFWHNILLFLLQLQSLIRHSVCKNAIAASARLYFFLPWSKYAKNKLQSEISRAKASIPFFEEMMKKNSNAVKVNVVVTLFVTIWCFCIIDGFTFLRGGAMLRVVWFLVKPIIVPARQLFTCDWQQLGHVRKKTCDSFAAGAVVWKLLPSHAPNFSAP